MQKIDPSLVPASAQSNGTVVQATYSATSLLRRALLGLLIMALFTSASAWLLHATTTEPPQAATYRQP